LDDALLVVVLRRNSKGREVNTLANALRCEMYLELVDESGDS